jgi:formiminotetrahydrofolate cyclodeaminase
MKRKQRACEQVASLGETQMLNINLVQRIDETDEAFETRLFSELEKQLKGEEQQRREVLQQQLEDVLAEEMRERRIELTQQLRDELRQRCTKN